MITISKFFETEVKSTNLSMNIDEVKKDYVSILKNDVDKTITEKNIFYVMNVYCDKCGKIVEIFNDVSGNLITIYHEDFESQDEKILCSKCQNKKDSEEY